MSTKPDRILCRDLTFGALITCQKGNISLKREFIDNTKPRKIIENHSGVLSMKIF